MFDVVILIVHVYFFGLIQLSKHFYASVTIVACLGHLLCCREPDLQYVRGNICIYSWMLRLTIYLYYQRIG